MALDVVDLRTFYASPLGGVAQRLIQQNLHHHWTDVRGMRVAGIGFATPYLSAFRAEADRVMALMPASQGVLEWPPEGPFASTLVEESELPLDDGSIDRALVVHLLEATDSIPDTLREIWRVLAPGGTLLLVVPSRRGIWARVDRTPFGYGQPFSKTQVTSALRDAMFSPVGWSDALFMPPLRYRWLLRAAPIYERAAATLAFPFAGVHVVEASKQVFRPVAVRTRRVAAPRLRPVLLPSPARRDGTDAV